jgi:hypothetical protein
MIYPTFYSIWKYPVQMEDSFILDLPVDSLPLSVQVQAGTPYVWVAVTDTSRQERHRFYLRGTGHPLKDADPKTFIGTFQFPERGLVFHLFDGGQEECQT